MQPSHDPAAYGVPDGWPRARPSTGTVLAAGFLAVLAAAGIAGAVWAAASGRATAAVLLAAAAVYLGHIAGLGVSVWRHPRRGRAPALGGTDRGEPGLAFTYARSPYYWLIAVLLLTALGLLGVTVVAAVTGTAAGWVIAVLALALAAVIGWFAAVVLRLAPGRLVLTPDGIYHRSLTFEHFVPWYAVYDVTAESGPGPMLVVKANPADGTRVRRYSGRLGTHAARLLPFVAVPAYWLGANAGRAYRATDHYFRHPDRRPELSSATALQTFSAN
jgi:hypothetical protein